MHMLFILVYNILFFLFFSGLHSLLTHSVVREALNIEINNAFRSDYAQSEVKQEEKKSHSNLTTTALDAEARHQR